MDNIILLLIYFVAFNIITLVAMGFVTAFTYVAQRLTGHRRRSCH